jgi:D-glycero-D-manno-heptose 1,7-bisphosphate phosphatase
MAEIPQHRIISPLSGPRPALLLDRDGVVNIDKGFVAAREHFEWRAGIFRLAEIASSYEIPIVIVTNQTGIGRGYYSQTDFDRLTGWMCTEFARRGTPIARVYHCAHHPDSLEPELKAHHPWRKPEPGMLLAARDELDLDLARSVMVGDQWSDMLAAANAGVGHAILVGEPRPPRPAPAPAILRFPDVEAVADWYADHCSQSIPAAAE